ncbi:MAG: sterol desaturase family protein [Aquabacterium sp.]|nr:sterol desaturase family protein [Aquabacterium sp.]
MNSDIMHAIMYLLIAGAVFIFVITAEAVYLKVKGVEGAYDLKETASNLFAGFNYKLLDGVFVALVAAGVHEYFYQHGLKYSFENKWIAYPLLFLLTDLSFYQGHVLMHKVRYFWCAHHNHHSSARYNFSTALRQNFLVDFSGIFLLMVIPLALIGFDKTSVVVALELNLFYQFFVHTTVIKRMPNWVEMIFSTPSHHRVHHGKNPAQIDTNFGGVLIVWDRIFGTFIDERNAGEIAYGVAFRQPSTNNPFRLALMEFFSMCSDVWRYKDIRIVWKRPDWVEERYR